MAARQQSGKTADLSDGIAVAQHATLATRDTRYFADLPVSVVDPWTD